jgi:hypothetical protein
MLVDVQWPTRQCLLLRCHKVKFPEFFFCEEMLRVETSFLLQIKLMNQKSQKGNFINILVRLYLAHMKFLINLKGSFMHSVR